MRFDPLNWAIVVLTFFILSVETRADSIERLAYCELFDSHRFNQENIITKAILFVPEQVRPVVDGGDSFFYSADCNNRDYFALANLSPGLMYRAENVERALSFLDEGSYSIEFEGGFSLSLLPTYGHLGSFRAEFNVVSVIAIEPLDKPGLAPDLEKTATSIQMAISLDAENTEFVKWMIRASEERQGEGLLSQRAVFDLNGAMTTRSKFLETVRKTEFKRMRNETTYFRKENDVWKICGTIEIISEDETVHSLDYVNIYSFNLEYDRWELLRSSVVF